VTCDPDDQLARVERRGNAGADARQRISAQGDLAERLAPAATRVLDTSGAESRAREAAMAALLAAGVRSG